MSKCKCVEKLNKQLASKGVELETAMSLSLATGRASVEGPLMAVTWVGKKPRNKSLPVLVCSFCPICGVKK